MIKRKDGKLSCGGMSQIVVPISSFYRLPIYNQTIPVNVNIDHRRLSFKYLQGFGPLCPLFFFEEREEHYCGGNIEYHTGLSFFLQRECNRGRIFVIVTGVSVKRLHDLSLQEARIEIDAAYSSPSYGKTLLSGGLGEDKEIQNRFIELWDRVAPEGCLWEDNPFVVVSTLSVHKSQKGSNNG